MQVDLSTIDPRRRFPAQNNGSPVLQGRRAIFGPFSSFEICYCAPLEPSRHTGCSYPQHCPHLPRAAASLLKPITAVVRGFVRFPATPPRRRPGRMLPRGVSSEGGQPARSTPDRTLPVRTTAGGTTAGGTRGPGTDRIWAHEFGETASPSGGRPSLWIIRTGRLTPSAASPRSGIFERDRFLPAATGLGTDCPAAASVDCAG
jgi:hypothetical protein